MASFINGKLSNEPIAKVTKDGDFDRPDSGFRDTISPDEAEKERYHLYVSYACPWAHRTLIVRKIKKLEELIGVSVSDAYMGEKGWTFSSKEDPELLSELYVASDRDYTGKITVPVLWDKKKKTIVNNESSEIIRILNSSFDHLTDSTIDLYPPHLREKIDEINHQIYHGINNGVYKVGFAASQKAYDHAFDELFKGLDEMEAHLSENPFLAGEYFTEADVRFFTTLIRFDAVYVGHFKCNKKRISDYPNLSNYTRSIYQMPEVKETCHFDHIKEHYYTSHKWINPNGIIPKGPELDLLAPHSRGEIRFWEKKH